MKLLQEGRGTGWQRILFKIEQETTRKNNLIGCRFKVSYKIDKTYYFGHNIVVELSVKGGKNLGREIRKGMTESQAKNASSSGSAIFPANGDYYWYADGYADNKIENCQMKIKSTTGSTIQLDTGKFDLTAPVGYVASEVSSEVNFNIGNDLEIVIRDITNQAYSYTAVLEVLKNDNTTWESISTVNTANKTFAFALSGQASTLYSLLSTRNIAPTRVKLTTKMRND